MTNGVQKQGQQEVAKQTKQTTFVEKFRARVEALTDGGQIELPTDYSYHNAIISWYLVLKATVDKNKKSALEICTPDSIANATMDMVVQGLNPASKQCYAIVYGTTLVCQRSYFGDEAILRRIYGPGTRVFSVTVYNDDKLTYEIDDEGRKRVTSHVQSLDNIGGLDSIKAAYATAIFGDGSPTQSEIMTLDQIKTSWKKSKTWKGPGGNSPHVDFPDRFAERTVLRRLCTRLISANVDTSYLSKAADRQAMLVADAEINEELDTVAAEAEVIDLPTAAEEVIEVAPEEQTTEGDDGKRREAEGEEAAPTGGDGEEVLEGTPSEEPPADEVESPSSPSARWGDFIEAHELNPTKARKVLCGIVGVADGRSLTNDHFTSAMEDAENFLALYNEGEKPNPNGGLFGGQG